MLRIFLLEFLVLLSLNAAPQLPKTFILEVYTTSNITERIFVDEYRGVRIESTYRGDNIPHIATLFPDDGYRYTIMNHLFTFRVDPPFCYSEPKGLSGRQPFKFPTFISKVNVNAAIDNLPVNAWLVNSSVDHYEWWYMYNTSLSVLFPSGWARPDDRGSVVTDFILAQPPSWAYKIPDCYSIYGEPMKRDSSFVWPSSFSLSLIERTRSTKVLVDANKQWQRTELTTMISGSPAFTQYDTSRDNITYHHENWLNISPPPCVYESFPTVFWENPLLTHVGMVHVIEPGISMFDVYAHKGSPIWWLIGNTSIPYGRVSSLGEFEVGSWSPYVPPPNAFSIPPVCFPAIRSNTTSSFASKPAYGAPVFPQGFTLYGIESHHPHNLVLYYDAKTGYTRIDRGDMTVLQRGQDRYMYSTVINARISPLPCIHRIVTTPLFQLPIFDKHVTNATIDGKTVSVWSALDTETTRMNILRYWYIDTTTMTPLYYTSLLGSTFVSFFQSTTPPLGVFDVTDECKVVPISN